MLADIYGLLRLNPNNSGDPPPPFHLAPPEVQMFIKFVSWCVIIIIVSQGYSVALDIVLYYV